MMSSTELEDGIPYTNALIIFRRVRPFPDHPHLIEAEEALDIEREIMKPPTSFGHTYPWSVQP